MIDENDDIIKEFLIECSEHLDVLDNGFIATEKDPSDRKILSGIFRSIHTIKGGAGMLGFNKLEKLTHAAESLLSLVRDGKLTLNSDMTSTLLQTVDAVRYMLECLIKNSNDGENDYLPLIEALNQLQSNQPPADDSHPPVSEDVATPVSTPEVIIANNEPNSTDSKLTSVVETSVRINVELLDKLMNLVGELVLSRNQILQCLSTQSDSNFIAVSQRLNLITSELQEGVMKTRMQPIGNVWGKYPRVVHDLAVACNKKIKLEMFGSETELDKTLIEAIKDPLMHIVRNSVDHGIEIPEKRLAIGKPEEGTLSLKAYHESGQVNIVVTDDGGGISPESVKKKAIDKGFITVEQAGRMNERDVLNLIFLPGLSTAEKVTNVSGRGVGMDVVRTNIERINGTIDIQSTFGHSTSLKIKIPLTLAIIPALIITCGSNYYAIPQVSLLELVRLEFDQAKNDIQYIKDTPVYKLRGKLLSLVYLSEELGLEVDEHADKQDEVVNIVVLQAGETHFGLVVDAINDTQEIVVKPLSKLLRHLLVFTGATIMGDGTISLILDVVGLARKAGFLSSTAQTNKLNNSGQLHSDASQKQTLLLLRSGKDNLMAVPLNKVDRIEEFSISIIEMAGKQEVVQYRDAIMPLVRLACFINDAYEDADNQDTVQVIVYSRGSQNMGLIVDHVYDIVDVTFELEEHISRPGVVGTLVIDDKVTEILDIEEIISTALPHYFDEMVS